MTTRRKESRSFMPIASSCALGMAATLTLGACGLESVVAPAEAMEPPQVAMDSNGPTESSQGTAVPGHETAEVPTAAADEAPEGASGTTTCWPSLTSAERPLIIVDGERSEACWDEIAALDIHSFELVRGAAAVYIYGEDARRGVIVIATKQSGGDGKGDGTPGDPSN